MRCRLNNCPWPSHSRGWCRHCYALLYHFAAVAAARKRFKPTHSREAFLSALDVRALRELGKSWPLAAQGIHRYSRLCT